MRNSDTQVEKSPIIRRQIMKEFSDGKFTPNMLFHMVHHSKSASLMIETAKSQKRPISVVDIGCGDGWPLKILIRGSMVKKAEILNSYTGVDVVQCFENPFGPQLSKEIQFRFIEQDMEKNQSIEIPRRSVDFVNCTEFIEHISKDSAQVVISEIARMLKVNGILYITTPNGDNSKHSDQYHIYEWGMQELVEFLGILKFSIIAISGTYIEKRVFERANEIHKRFSPELIKEFTERFTPSWRRVLLATPYPEYSEGIAIVARKDG
jgi:2-polyprenyl-3-methyl-5-hydroxy-6-metoxy-1,4-benzoquinol methylase